jgi:hypothetical protein
LPHTATGPELLLLSPELLPCPLLLLSDPLPSVVALLDELSFGHASPHEVSAIVVASELVSAGDVVVGVIVVDIPVLLPSAEDDEPPDAASSPF